MKTFVSLASAAAVLCMMADPTVAVELNTLNQISAIKTGKKQQQEAEEQPANAAAPVAEDATQAEAEDDYSAAEWTEEELLQHIEEDDPNGGSGFQDQIADQFNSTFNKIINCFGACELIEE